MKCLKIWVAAALAALATLPAAASEQYRNYTYDRRGNAYLEPQAYTPTGVLDGDNLGVGKFKEPGDVNVGADGRVFVADTGNNRIVAISKDFKRAEVWSRFERDGKPDVFHGPEGVFAAEDGRVYVADTGAARILLFSPEGRLLRVFDVPEKVRELTEFEYKPVRVAADSADRMFVVSADNNKGMIELDSEGEFVGFFGVPSVPPSLAELFWNRVLSRTQKDKSVHTLPTEYSANDIDDEGFVFGSAVATTGHTVRRLNPQGSDILRRTGFFPPGGDLHTRYVDGALETSLLTDIAYVGNGMYAVLDSRRGRVFTYDHDGNLLFVFGGIGKGLGSLSLPRALDVLPDGRYLVLDRVLAKAVIYEPTEYARLILRASAFQYEREYEKAETEWSKVLSLTANSEIAYSGMGKALYRQKRYKEAMEYFKLGGNRMFYSKAFKGYRKAVINRFFPALPIPAAAGVAIGFAVKGVRIFRRRRKS